MPRELIAIIPARGGSKGVPRKNVRLLGGKPLVAWSIEAALKSGVVDRVFVSTEDEEIADISRRWGAEVPFLRPAALAGDTSLVGDAISNMVDRLFKGGCPIWGYLTLYPTSPFREKAMFQAARDALKDGCASFVTVHSTGHEDSFVTMDGQGVVSPLSVSRRGEARGHYAKPLGLLSAKPYDRRSGPNHVWKVDDPVQCIDLDTERDFQLAEQVLAEGLYSYA